MTGCPLHARIRPSIGGLIEPGVNEVAEYKVDLSDEDLARLADLAKRRGVSANTVIQQALATEKLIADNVEPTDELLIKKGDSFKKITFN